MRGRRLKKAGRRAALFMAFMMAFSATSTYTVQTIEAANAALGDMRSEEELKAMVSVGTVVREDWQKDARLKQLLTERDLKAAEYARENNLNGVYNTSGSIGSYGDTSNEWLSNVLYKGDILRYDTFDGFIAVYNGGADAAVIEDGINEIDVLLIPISDLQVSANGIETDISTWETIPGFASRIMLPHWNGEGGIDLKHRNGYRTKLFIVGVRGGALAKGGIYDKDNKLDYASYLSYIGAEASTENLASYMSYLKTYDDITDDDWDEWEDWDEWYDWYDWNQGDGSGGSKESGGRSTPAGGDTPVDPGRPAKGRTIMIYMDGADLTESATLNLYTMLTASNTVDIGEDNHIVVLTGGSKEKWTRSDGKVDDYLYNTSGEKDASLAANLGMNNQLWELRDGKLTLIQNGFNDNGYMTQGANLAAFIKAVKSRYPDAAMYDLIMWDHGGGPEGGFGADLRRNDDQSMSLVDMTNAVKDSGVSFDLIAFDACLMANAEVALALSPYTQYFMLSEQEFPGKGLNAGYTDIVKGLINENNVATEDYAKAVIHSAIDSYREDADDAIMALIDSAKVSNDLANAIAGFASALKEVIERNDQDTLDTILKIRKTYNYIEVKSSDAETGDLIDVQGFCDALMADRDGELRSKDAKLYAACQNLKTAAAACVIHKETVARMDRALAQGTEPTGISMYFPALSMAATPIGQTTGITDQVLNLVNAYKSSGKLDSYGKAIAAYGLWLKVGKMLGDERFWRDGTARTDADMKDMVKRQQGDWSVNGLVTASGLTDAEADNLIEAQIRDRIKKSNITVTDITDDQHNVTGKKVTVRTGDPGIVDRIDAKVYVNEGEGENRTPVSLGRSTMRTTEVEKNITNNTATADILPFDNKWLVLDGHVVSYYDTEIRDLTENNVTNRYRVGVIPVAYWKQARVGDATDSTLKAAIDNDKVMIGVFEIRFPLEGNDFSDSGKITDFRKVNDNAISKSGYDILENEIYELLAGFDDGNNPDKLRSVGVVKATANGDNLNLKTAQFELINNLSVEYSIVDAYESRYELNSENFGQGDPRAVDSYRDPNTQGAMDAPVASKNTADQSGLGGGTNYDDRESKAGADGAAGEAVADAAEAGDLTAGAGDIDAAAATDTAQAAESPAAAEATDTGTVDINQNTAPAAAPAVVLSPEQQAFLANISAGLAGGTMTLEQAAALIGTAGITPEQVDAYMAGTGASASEQTAADPAAIAADPALTPAADPAIAPAADPATSPAADPMAAADLPAADPMAVSGVPAAGADYTGSDPSSDVTSSYVDAAPPEESAYTGDDSGSGDIGSGDGGSDGGSSDSGSDSGSDDGGSDDGGSDDGGSSDSSEGDSE